MKENGAKKLKVSILIPAHNEAKSIEKCIALCLRQTRKADEIIIVNDGSNDETTKVVESFENQIGFDDNLVLVDLSRNTGNKSLAQQIGLKHITGDILITTDADTVLDEEFVEHILPHFEDVRVAAVAGYVRSLKHNWITAAREIDYVIGQEVFKTAQGFLNYLLVIPGCAAAFRMETFRRHIEFSHDTVTEDLDFTYQLHKKGYRIDFEKRSIVYTQDPPNISSYIRQMKRWYGGGWQNLLKHSNIALIKPAAALELSLTYIEGLVTGIMLFVVPVVNLSIYIERFLPLYVLLIAVIALLAAIKDRRPDLFFSFPGYLILVYINAFIFFGQFIKEGILRKNNMVWLTADRTNI